MPCSGFRVRGLGFRVQGSGFRTLVVVHHEGVSGSEEGSYLRLIDSYGGRGALPQHGFSRKSNDWTLVSSNLLVRIHFIIVMIRWTGLALWGFEFPFPGSLTSTFILRLPTSASGRRGDSLKCYKDFYLKAKAGIWP